MNNSKNSQHLKKDLEIIDLFTIGFGAIIGVGWVITIGKWIDSAGGAIPAILAFISASFILIPISKAYGELASSMPEAGGPIAYSRIALGKFWSFIGGWYLALAYIMMCPWEIIAIGQLLETLFPSFKNFPIYEIQGSVVYLPTLILSLIIGFVVMYINFRGVDLVVKFQKRFIGILLGIVVIALCVSLMKGNLSNLLPVVAKTEGNKEGSLLKGFLSVLAITPFFFSGFDTIPQAAEELKESVSKKKIGKVLSISVISASVFYALIILAVTLVLPWKDIISMELPAAEVYTKGLDMNFLTRLIIIGAFCGTLTCLNSFFISSAKVLLSLSKSNMIPNYFGKLHSKFQTPVVANLFIGVIVIVGAFLGKGMIKPLVNVCSFGFLFVWFQVAIDAKIIRIKYPKLHRPYKVKSSTLSVAVFLSIIMLLLLLIPGSPASLELIEVIIIIIWLILGLILYLYMNYMTKDSHEDEEKMCNNKYDI